MCVAWRLNEMMHGKLLSSALSPEVVFLQETAERASASVFASSVFWCDTETQTGWLKTTSVFFSPPRPPSTHPYSLLKALGQGSPTPGLQPVWNWVAQQEMSSRWESKQSFICPFHSSPSPILLPELSPLLSMEKLSFTKPVPCAEKVRDCSLREASSCLFQLGWWCQSWCILGLQPHHPAPHPLHHHWQPSLHVCLHMAF